MGASLDYLFSHVVVGSSPLLSGKIGIISRTDQLDVTLPFRIRAKYRMVRLQWCYVPSDLFESACAKGARRLSVSPLVRWVSRRQTERWG
jgi:hypothetical protein